jgi:hypothetical protein
MADDEPTPAWMRPRPNGWFVAIGVALTALVGVLGYIAGTRETHDVAAAEPSVAPAAPPPAAVAAPPVKTPADRILATPGRVEALGIARPFMVDRFNGDSDGTVLAAVWANRYMKWSDAEPLVNETSIAAIRKDPEEALGLRLCSRGSVVEIHTSKTDAGKLYTGRLITASGDIVRFAAAGSTGALVEGSSDARLCGIVTGLDEYQNSAGGTGHGVVVVGMFDLPENRRRKP